MRVGKNDISGLLSARDWPAYCQKTIVPRSVLFKDAVGRIRSFGSILLRFHLNENTSFLFRLTLGLFCPSSRPHRED